MGDGQGNGAEPRYSSTRSNQGSELSLDPTSLSRPEPEPQAHRELWDLLETQAEIRLDEIRLRVLSDSSLEALVGDSDNDPLPSIASVVKERVIAIMRGRLAHLSAFGDGLGEGQPHRDTTLPAVRSQSVDSGRGARTGRRRKEVLRALESPSPMTPPQVEALIDEFIDQARQGRELPWVEVAGDLLSEHLHTVRLSGRPPAPESGGLAQSLAQLGVVVARSDRDNRTVEGLSYAAALSVLPDRSYPLFARLADLLLTNTTAGLAYHAPSAGDRSYLRGGAYTMTRLAALLAQPVHGAASRDSSVGHLEPHALSVLATLAKANWGQVAGETDANAAHLGTMSGAAALELQSHVEWVARTMYNAGVSMLSAREGPGRARQRATVNAVPFLAQERGDLAPVTRATWDDLYKDLATNLVGSLVDLTMHSPQDNSTPGLTAALRQLEVHIRQFGLDRTDRMVAGLRILLDRTGDTRAVDEKGSMMPLVAGLTSREPGAVQSVSWWELIDGLWKAPVTNEAGAIQPDPSDYAQVREWLHATPESSADIRSAVDADLMMSCPDNHGDYPRTHSGPDSDAHVRLVQQLMARDVVERRRRIAGLLNPRATGTAGDA